MLVIAECIPSIGWSCNTCGAATGAFFGRRGEKSQREIHYGKFRLEVCEIVSGAVATTATANRISHLDICTFQLSDGEMTPQSSAVRQVQTANKHMPSLNTRLVFFSTDYLFIYLLLGRNVPALLCFACIFRAQLKNMTMIDVCILIMIITT